MTTDTTGGQAPQPGGIHFGVLDIIKGSDDRPTVRQDAIQTFANGIDQMLERGPEAFRLNIDLPSGSKLSMLWQRPVPTAGYILWGTQDTLYAVTVLLSGLNDADDRTCLDRLRQHPGVSLPSAYFTDLLEMERPGIATLYVRNESITSTPITEAAIGTAKAAFHRMRATGKKPPL